MEETSPTSQEKKSEQTLRGEPAAAAAGTEGLSDGGAGLATTLAENAAKIPFQKIYGGILLFASVGALSALALAYSPHALEPSSQAAAAGASEHNPFDEVEVGAHAVYVYDAAKGEELFAKNSTVQLPLASITKVMLVLAVAEVLPLDGTVVVSREAVERGEGGLTWGEEWRVRDLVDYTLITSSNSGAEALAEAADAPLRAKYPAAPRGGAAVWRMNSLAQEFGLDATYFLNPSGLDESASQAGALGSARDIAILFAHALKERELFSGTTRSGVSFAPLNFPERTATNTNNALANISGILMGKTGTTDLAGGNLAVAFDAARGHPVIIIVLGATHEGRYEDVKKLVETARAGLSSGR